jgi:hypothetical protein
MSKALNASRKRIYIVFYIFHTFFENSSSALLQESVPCLCFKPRWLSVVVLYSWSLSKRILSHTLSGPLVSRSLYCFIFDKWASIPWINNPEKSHRAWTTENEWLLNIFCCYLIKATCFVQWQLLKGRAQFIRNHIHTNITWITFNTTHVYSTVQQYL